jgi:hypothetical protein
MSALQSDLGGLHVVARAFVERRDDDFAVLDGATPACGLFGTLVDEQHDQVAVGVVLVDRLADLLEQDRLARTRRRHNQATLSFADRREQIDHA